MLLPTDQYCFILPPGYRYAVEEEVEQHNNWGKIDNAVLVWMEGTSGDSIVYNLAVPMDYSLGEAQHLSHDLSEFGV